MKTNNSWHTQVYRKALIVLPTDLRREGAEEMIQTFADLLNSASGPLARLLLLVRCLFALPQVAAIETFDLWRDARHNPTERATSMSQWIKDLAYGVRTLKRAPGFTLSAVLLLGLGIGAVTSIFTLVDHILLRPLPYPEAQRLVMIEDGSHTGPFFKELSTLPSAEAWAGAWSASTNLTESGDPVQLTAASVTRSFFQIFGAQASEGRLLAPDDFAAADAVVLSDGLWRRMFSADPEIVGQRITLDDEAVTIVGVMERRFTTPEALTGPDVDLYRPVDWSIPDLSQHDTYVLEIVGRTSLGAHAEDVEREVAGLVAKLDKIAPKQYRGRDEELWLPAVTKLGDVTVRGVRAGLGLLLGAVGLLLLIACSNVGHLFLARGLSRGPELAVRRSLGASTSSLVRQLLIEGLVVALLGGMIGVALSAGAVRALLALVPEAIPREGSVSLDLRVMLFAAALSSLTVLFFGLLPALRTAGKSSNLQSSVRSETQDNGVGRLRGGLIAAEIALSMMLLAGAGVLIRSFLEVTKQDPGIEAEHVWTLPLNLTDSEDGEAYRGRIEPIREALLALPSVESASYGLAMPFSFTGGSKCCWRSRYSHVPERDEPFLMTTHPVETSYFDTLGMRFIQGSAWSNADARSQPWPAVITASTAAEHFGSAEAAVGQVVSMTEETTIRIGGVVADNRHFGLDRDHGDAIYLPMAMIDFAPERAEFAVKLRGEAPLGLARALREAVWSAAPSQPVPEVLGLEARIESSTAMRRFDSILFGLFGAVALLLTAGGLYGTLLYTVGRRRREMGIRLALGAGKFQVEQQILSGAIKVSLIGISIGLAGAWATSQVLESRIWGVASHDVRAFAGAAILLLATTLLAGWLPARRAAQIDPAETLRAE